MTKAKRAKVKPGEWWTEGESHDVDIDFEKQAGKRVRLRLVRRDGEGGIAVRLDSTDIPLLCDVIKALSTQKTGIRVKKHAEGKANQGKTRPSKTRQREAK